MTTVIFCLLGYMSGSVLYARVFSKLLKKGDIAKESKDQNPGTSNAFKNGGFLCGVLTLIFDIAKGLLPVFLYREIGYADETAWGLTLIMAAPVIGHAFPLLYKFKGGKGIATTFGCLLGLLPLWQPVIILALCFVFFSTALQISPHYYRTLIAYAVSLISMLFFPIQSTVWAGFAAITAVVFVRMFLSAEEKEKMRMKLLWMH